MIVAIFACGSFLFIGGVLGRSAEGQATSRQSQAAPGIDNPY